MAGRLRTERFREVPRGGDFTVVLSQASRLPGFSSVCSTTYSCRVGRYVVINQDRWRPARRTSRPTLEEYRRMVVNHETGHWLGRGHAYCPGRARRLAPVMQQQSKGMQGCRSTRGRSPRETRRLRDALARAAPALGVALVAVLAATLLGSGPADAAAPPTPGSRLTGGDISWPNCPKGMGIPSGAARATRCRWPRRRSGSSG